MTFTIDQVRGALGRMVGHYEKQTGNKTEALALAARKCRMLPRTLRRLINGDSKMNGLQTSINIRDAYRKYLKEKIAEMQAELVKLDAEDEVSGIWEIDQQISDLQSKFDAIKERLTA